MPVRAPVPVTGRLRLRTLGGAALDLLDDDGTVIDHQDMSKAIALVTYLASVPTRSASREHLVDLLWSDLDADAAKHALRQHLWHLRRRFGDVLLSDRKTQVRLGPGIDFDRDTLLAAAERGQCDRVVELYGGDFFPGFAAPGSNELERWIDVERARLRTVFIRCAEQLVRQWLSVGRARDGQALARRVRDTEPLAQHGWRLLIEAHISGSDELGARVEADAFERYLADEEMEAEPASRAMVAAARRGGARKSDEPKGPFSELVGRAAEFAWLVDAWNAASSGRASAVRIVAPAGLGKTRLLHEFRARLASIRARVVVVRADADSRAIPLALASDLVVAIGALPGAGGVTPEVASTLVGLAPALGSIFPAAQATRGQADEPHVRRSAVRELLAAVAEERPLAVLIDDFHWSDRESAAMLAGAFGALGKQRVLIVIAQRPSEGTAPLLHDAHEFTLAPLSESAVGALLASIASLPLAKWSGLLPTELRRATGGSPLLVVETLQLAMQRQVLATTNGEWRCADARALIELLREGGSVRNRLAVLTDRDLTIVRLLSMAKAALPSDLLAAASRQPIDSLLERLTALERSGLVVHLREGWQIGHDEFAMAALAGMPATEVPLLHAALGHALIDSADATDRLRRLAPNQLRLGDAWPRLRTAFAVTVSESVQRGERRSLAGLAAEFLGDTATDGDSARLVGMLPLHLRVGLVTMRRKVAALTLALAVPALGVLFAFARGPVGEPAPDYVALIAFRDSAGGLELLELPMTEQALRSDSALVLSSTNRPIRLGTVYESGAGPSPADSHKWLTVHSMADSGVTDLFLFNSKDGGNQRLTDAPADDTGPVWSPDGELAVFASDRWSPVGRTSLAILTPRTRHVRRLTSGDHRDTGAFWSPDGSRIAFSRHRTDGTASHCTVTTDGHVGRCHLLPVGGAPIGWISDSVTMVARPEGDQVVLTRMNVDSGIEERSGILSRWPRLSADGRWLLCDCRDFDKGTPSLTVIRTDDPTVRRRITIRGPHADPVDVWWRDARARQHIARVALSKGYGEPRIGVAYRLTAKAFDQSGQVRSMPVRMFSVSDTSIASIDSTGFLIGHRAGPVTAYLSAGGWRRDSLVLNVAVNRRDTLFTEGWRHDIEPTWIEFGEPRPLITTDRAVGSAFSTNGDGRFHSGAVTRADFPTTGGLSLSTTISTPITLSQWQELEVELNLAVDTALVRRWNSRSGYFWAMGHSGAAPVRCHFKYPSGPEGDRYGETLQMDLKQSAVVRSASPSMRAGRWTKLIVQVFPDGRCGIALNGIALLVAGETSPFTVVPARARIVVMGNSHQTRILVGPITLREGVDTAIDWSMTQPAARRTSFETDAAKTKSGLASTRKLP